MIYKLLVALLLGMILGIWFWEKVGVGDQYKAYISKLKQKGRNNAQDVIFEPILGSNGESKGKPLSKRKLAKIERKKQKVLKRLDRLD